MKKFYIFFLTLIVLSIQTSHAQREYGELFKKFKSTHEKITSIDSNLVGSVTVYLVDNSKKRYTYTYCDNGNMLTSTLENNYGSKWIISERITKTFDEMGNVLTELTEKSDGDDWWYGVTSSTYTYDTKGNELSCLVATFDDAYWKWVYSAKISRVYDENGNALSQVDEKWENGHWVNLYQSLFLNDINGNWIRGTYSSWQNDDWVNVYQLNYTYDDDNNRASLLRETWINDEWVKDYRITYTYDDVGHNLTELKENWGTELWENFNQKTMTYDQKGNILTWLDEYWENDEWILSQQETYTYDSSGNQLTYFYDSYSDGVLDFAERDYYTYDSKGNEIYWKWTELVDGVYVDRDQRITTYNPNGNVLTMLYQTWDGSQWTNTNSTLGFSDYKERAFGFNGYKIEVTYQGTIGIEEENISNFKSLEIYPNPANDFIAISSVNNQIKIFNIMGREVWSGIVSDSVRISVIDFTPGFYYIVSEGIAKTQNFVIIR